MANSALEYFCDSLGNVVLRDADGNPSIFVRHPKQKSSEFDASLPEHTHPAFIVNNAEDPAILIGKYKASELKTNGTLYSLPNMPPKVSASFEDFLQRMQAANSAATAMTIADHGLMVLMAHNAEWASHGNTNFGVDNSVGARYELNKSVAVNDVRIFRGWEYTCLIAHTTAETLLPVDAPAYWKKGRQVGGTPDVSGAPTAASGYQYARTLTGSGPLNWHFLDDVCLEADIVGNVYETIGGLRLVNCEIQIIPDNNAADPSCDQGAESSAWRAIKPHANDDGHDLVAPGTSGTVHFNWLDSKLTLDTVVPNFDGVNRNTKFKDIAVNATNLPHVPAILYELGLAPLPGTTVDGTVYVKFSADEFIARRGGNSGMASNAGIATLHMQNTRAGAGTYGARLRARTSV